MRNGASELIHAGEGETPIPDSSVDCPSLEARAPGANTQGSSHFQADMRSKILALETAMKSMPDQIEIPTFHHFAPGVYMREIRIPKGATVVGKIHKTEHLNVLSKGRLHLATEDGTRVVEASMVVKSSPGVRRAAVALEDSVWITVHPNVDDEQSVSALEERLVTDSYEQFLEFMEGEIKCLSSQ